MFNQLVYGVSIVPVKSSNYIRPTYDSLTNPKYSKILNKYSEVIKYVTNAAIKAGDVDPNKVSNDVKLIILTIALNYKKMLDKFNIKSNGDMLYGRSIMAVLLAIIFRESGFNPKLSNGKYVGLFQLYSTTADSDFNIYLKSLGTLNERRIAMRNGIYDVVENTLAGMYTIFRYLSSVVNAHSRGKLPSRSGNREHDSIWINTLLYHNVGNYKISSITRQAVVNYCFPILNINDTPDKKELFYSTIEKLIHSNKKRDKYSLIPTLKR